MQPASFRHTQRPLDHIPIIEVQTWRQGDRAYLWLGAEFRVQGRESVLTVADRW